jgi:ABC-type Fe3+/spermidine/putrescine transport system ATPase subunit
VDALTRGRKALLCVDNVSVAFDGFKAITDLTLILDEGELRCIIGPNGAGKTTLQDIITGKTKPDSGSVFLVGDNTDLTELNEYEIAERGICRKFQRPTVFQGHSVFENLELALPGKKGVFASLFSRLSKAQHERIDEKIVRLVVRDVPRHILRELDHKALREYKRRALHFNLDTRRPEIVRPEKGEGAPGRRASLADTVRDKLRSRPLTENIDREALVELGLHYLREADLVAGPTGEEAVA